MYLDTSTKKRKTREFALMCAAKQLGMLVFGNQRRYKGPLKIIKSNVLVYTGPWGKA